MNTELKRYSEEYREDIIKKIGAFFGFHLNLNGNSSNVIDRVTAERDLEDWITGDNELYVITAEVVGCVGFLRIGYRGDTVAWIEDVFVDEKYRNMGIATNSIRQAEEIIKAKPQFTAVCLDVVPGNIEALKLYHKLGYDVLSMLTLRKEFQSKDNNSVESIRGINFKY